VKEPAYLVCAPAAWGPRAAVKGTSLGHSCSECSCQLQIGPSGVRLMGQRPIELICVECFLKDAICGEDVTTEPPSAEQIRELVAALREPPEDVN
jgi:hypothetical protein